jgi:acyl-CoA reductase-like NAD-dependent aldehyde dehydrogenase
MLVEIFEFLASMAASFENALPPCQWPMYLCGLAVVYLTYKTWVVRGGRRAPSLPARDDKRTLPRGTGPKMVCTNPATGETLPDDIREYTADDVQKAYQSAAAAAKDWAKTNFAERRATLMEISDWIIENQETIIEMSVRESGKTKTEASLGEVMTSCEKIRWLVAHGEGCLATESRPVPSLLMTKSARVEYYPLGVIGIIVPWNYPFFNIISAVVAALFSGNGAVVKPSEITSASAKPIEDMFRMILARRGHNPDLVQIVTGFSETGKALVTSGVDKILFIGSAMVGKLVMRAASANLTPVILELGGKDPFIVFDDVNIPNVADVAIRGAFINCGQNCIAAERIYVHEAIYDKFIEEVVSRMEKTAQGPSLIGKRRYDFGAITMKNQAKSVENLVQDAVKKGARLVMGGHRIAEDSKHECKDERADGGVYFEPTILADVTHKMEIANEETFGPVMTIIKFSNEDELIDMVNCTAYGLASSVFSGDYSRAERVGNRVVAGMCTINDFAMVPMVQSLPFGGVGHSGFGAFNGKEGLRGFSRTRSVVTDRLPFPMAAPAFLQYPVASNAKDIVKHGVRMVFGDSWTGSAVSLAKMLKEIVTSPKK